MQRRSLAAVMALTLVGGAVSSARAQPGAAPGQPPAPAPAPAPAAAPPPAPTPAPVPPDDATPIAPTDPRFPTAIQPPAGFVEDPAWSAYDRAFREAADGDVDRARAGLLELTTRWPGHPAQARATALVAAAAARPKRVRTSRVARGELVFWSTVSGVSLAANLCEALDCESDRAYAGVYTASLAGSLGLALLASRHGIHDGEAQLYDAAQTWGAWNALLINDGFAEGSTEASIAIAAQVGGLAAGIGLWQTWRPTPGAVALTNTFFLWGTVLTLWGHVAADEDPELATIVIAGDVALLAGAIASRALPNMSRGRTLLIDVGGILGTLGGGLIALGTDDSGAGVALMVSTGLGLGLAYALTSSWDHPPPVTVAPTVLRSPAHETGYGLMAGISF